MSLLELMKKKKQEIEQSNHEMLAAVKKEGTKTPHPLAERERGVRFAYLVGITMGALVDGPMNESERQVLRGLSSSLGLPESDVERAVESAQTPDEGVLSLVMDSLNDIETKTLFLADLWRIISIETIVNDKAQEVWTFFADVINMNNNIKQILPTIAKEEYSTMLNSLGVFFANVLGEEDYADEKKYARGRTASENDVYAVKWFQKSADLGGILGQSNLAWMYEHGRGVLSEPTKAAEWYLKAAKQGDARAQNNLGCLYNAGKGIEKNNAEAIGWFQQAAEQGNIHAQRNINRGDAILTLKGHKKGVLFAEFSPDGKLVLTSSWDETAKLWDAATGEELRTFRGHSSSVFTAVFSPNGKHMLTASADNTAKLWDISTGEVLRTLKAHENSVKSAFFSPDGKMILTASYDDDAVIWKRTTGEIMKVIHNHYPLAYASFSPDGCFVVTANDDNLSLFTKNDNSAKIYEVLTGKILLTLEGHTKYLTCASFSPDGAFVLTGSNDETVKIWSASTGERVQTFFGHNNIIRSAVFSPDGKTVLTASKDKTARLWNVRTGKEIRRIEGHDDDVRHAAFSPDGRLIITASEDETVKLWASFILPEE